MKPAELLNYLTEKGLRVDCTKTETLVLRFVWAASREDDRDGPSAAPDVAKHVEDELSELSRLVQSDAKATDVVEKLSRGELPDGWEPRVYRLVMQLDRAHNRIPKANEFLKRGLTVGEVAAKTDVFYRSLFLPSKPVNAPDKFADEIRERVDKALGYSEHSIVQDDAEWMVAEQELTPQQKQIALRKMHGKCQVLERDYVAGWLWFVCCLVNHSSHHARSSGRFHWNLRAPHGLPIARCLRCTRPRNSL
jgi:hypothetical protein